MTSFKLLNRTRGRSARLLSGLAFASATLIAACGSDDTVEPHQATSAELEEGKQTFRFDTFGDETFWTDQLKLHQVIAAAVDPLTALSVGLKVDSTALPPAVVKGIEDGSISLSSPATTVALLKLNAVVGLKGTVESVAGVDTLTHIGITCALCHSTVDNSYSKGIGKRLDGWPNRDLNPGAIIALSPALSVSEKALRNAWGPGKFDTRIAFDGKSNPILIPPAYGLKGINKITLTGDGDDIAYWNRLVAVAEMGGHGSVKDARINLNVTNGTDDRVSSKLATLGFYQLSIDAPPPPAGSFDGAAAERGKALFSGQAKCASCHSGTSFTDANQRLHPVSDAMGEPEPNGGVSFASRTATKMYRTTPLKGVWQHAPYFHNGSAATLVDVVKTYNTRQKLGLSADQISDLAQYLKSI